MRNSIVYILGVTILGLATAPALGQLDADDNELFEISSLFNDIPLKDVSDFPLSGLGEKNGEDKIAFDSPLAKILAIQNEENGGSFDSDTEDELTKMIDDLNSGDEQDMEAKIMSIINANNDNNDDDEIDVDAEALNYMTRIASRIPSSVENMIENLPLTENDLETIEGYERVIEDMIGQEMQKEILQGQVQNLPDIYSEEESSESEVGGGVVDYGGSVLFEGGARRWGGRRGGRFGGFGLFRQQQEQQQRQEEEEEEEEEKQREEERKEAGRRIFRRRKQQQQQEQEQQQQQQQKEEDVERRRRIANTIGRARNGARNTASLTRGNMRKAAEFTTENAIKTAMGLGEAMVDINGELTDVVSNIDFDPINAAATKTAMYMVGMAERKVPVEIMNDLLTTSEGNALETVKAVLLNSKRPEAMVPIVEEVGGNYAKVMKKVKSEMDGFLKVLFSNQEVDDL